MQNDGLGAVSLADGAALPFAPTLGCDVGALAVSGDTLHAGGCFGVRSYRAGVAVPGPSLDGTVSALLVTARAVCGRVAGSRAAWPTSTRPAPRWPARP